MRKKLEMILAAVLILAAVFAGPQSAKYVMSTKVEAAKPCIVVDAGHGGDDPGKVGTAGTKEKEINLQIANRLKSRLEADGMEVVLTRDTDESLADADASNEKVSDLQKRVEIIKDADPVVAVSIHQNSYPDSSVSGAQVFYYGQSAKGQKLAEAIQQSLIDLVDPENTRAAKANESYYILKKTTVPTVIVECGFLSNPDEEALLRQEDYQEKIVNAVAEGVENYLYPDADTQEELSE